MATVGIGLVGLLGGSMLTNLLWIRSGLVGLVRQRLGRSRA